ncbi:MAG: hypothetical protein NVV60_06485 [Luteimonas sp.]|nr:hypothetical protein [Luteimonas sp.]
MPLAPRIVASAAGPHWYSVCGWNGASTRSGAGCGAASATRSAGLIEHPANNDAAARMAPAAAQCILPLVVRMRIKPS